MISPYSGAVISTPFSSVIPNDCFMYEYDAMQVALRYNVI